MVDCPRRNAGLENATGDYILFVDSDDRIVAGSLTAILDCVENENANTLRKIYPERKNLSMIRYAKTLQGKKVWMLSAIWGLTMQEVHVQGVQTCFSKTLFVFLLTEGC